jgi:hypothetical protein
MMRSLQSETTLATLTAAHRAGSISPPSNVLRDFPLPDSRRRARLSRLTFTQLWMGLNLARTVTTNSEVLRARAGKKTAMKIALLALLGLMLGALGGAAFGIGAGLAWIEIFNTSNFEDYSRSLVFLTFMPLGARIGGLGGALLFGVIAVRDSEIAIEREPTPRRDG